MKRKLIAVALACAMVFSMIPSLAFADVEAQDQAVTVAVDAETGLPTDTEMITLLNAIEKYDYTKMELNNYKDQYYANIKAAADALDDLETATSSGTDAEKAFAGSVLTKISSYLPILVGTPATGTQGQEGYVAAVPGAIDKYNTRMVTILNKASEGFVVSDIYNTPSKGSEIPNLLEAYGTMFTPADAATIQALTNAELALFAGVVNDEIADFCVLTSGDGDDAADYTISVSPATIDLAAAVAAFPTIADVSTEAKLIAAIKDLSITGVDESAAKALVAKYNAAIAYCNEAVTNDFEAAMSVLTGYYTAGSNAFKMQNATAVAAEIQKAEAAYAKFVMDTKPSLDDLQVYEAAYVTMLVTEIGYTNTSDVVNADYIAATEAARAAYDKLDEHFAGQDSVVNGAKSAMGTAKGNIEGAETNINTYYKSEVVAAYAKVKDITAVTAENKADVEAFVNAYAAYEPTLDEDELKAIADGTDKKGKAYADKYAELKPLYEAFVKAEEDAEAAKDQAVKDLEAAKAQLEKLQKDAEANAAEIAALKAKIAFMESKAGGVKVKVGKKKATISWKKVDGAAKYKVYRATSKNGKFKAVKTTTKVKFTNKKLKKGKKYFYKVVAINADGVQSKDSKIVKSKKIK